MRNVFSILLRFSGLWLFNALSLQLCAMVVSGFEIHPLESAPMAVNIMSVALIFTLVNLLIRPLIMMLSIPLNTLSFGLFSLVVNAGMFYVVEEFSTILEIRDFGAAFFASFLFAIINSFITMLIPIDEDLLYYDILGNRMRRSSVDDNFTEKGIILLEIDGLSYSRIVGAIHRQVMPYLKELTDSGKFRISHFDCGIPSQTSSSQAGIMYGDNFNICAFRWYDKENNRVITSSNFSDMNRVESRILEKNTIGLLDNGISVNNLMSGNAAVSFFTVSSILPKSDEEARRRNLALYSYALKPYMLTKSLIFTVLDVFEEGLQYLWAILRNKTPRLNRMHRLYPLIRAITNVLLRDISTALTINEIHRNGVASYTTFYGYDEIAHHSGPDSYEAYRALRKIDRSIKQIHHSAERVSGRKYEMYVLSDHGQAFGATFRQRYQISLSEFIRSLAVKCAANECQLEVVSVENSADNNASVRAAITGMIESDQKIKPSRRSQAIEKIDHILEAADSNKMESDQKQTDFNIWVMASGNLANVYFPFTRKKASLEEIETEYPNLFTNLIEHPGIGLIIVHSEDIPRAVGKRGIRNLVTGEITGHDPLIQYGDPEVRAEQLRYLADFPEGGDLIIFSSVFPDGTVAAFEELIGSHGGMGGNQTDAFIFHQSDISIPDNITNSNQVFAFFNERRNTPVPLAQVNEHAEKKEEWGWSALLNGIKNTRKWTVYLRDILLYQTDVYRKVADDPELNGPAVLITLGSFLTFLSVFSVLQGFPDGTVTGAFFWFALTALRVIVSYLTMLILRDPFPYFQLVRVMLFNSIFDVLWLGMLIPGASGVWLFLSLANRFITSILALIGYANANRKKSLLILLLFTLSTIGTVIGMILIFTSLGYILNYDPLIQFMQIIDQRNQ